MSMTNLQPGQAATHTVEDLAEIAIGFLTGNDLSPATRDLFIVEGARVADWADEDEKIELIRDVVRKDLMEPANGRGNVAFLTTPEFMALAADWMFRSGDNIAYVLRETNVLLAHPWHTQQLVWYKPEDAAAAAEHATRLQEDLEAALTAVALTA
jgi:hypothetical protein